MAGVASRGEAGPLAKHTLRQFPFDRPRMKGITCKEIAGKLSKTIVYCRLKIGAKVQSCRGTELRNRFTEMF